MSNSFEYFPLTKPSKLNSGILAKYLFSCSENAGSGNTKLRIIRTSHIIIKIRKNILPFFMINLLPPLLLCLNKLHILDKFIFVVLRHFIKKLICVRNLFLLKAKI